VSAPATTVGTGTDRVRPSVAGPWIALRAAVRAAIFVTKMMPLRRSPADLVTRRPETLRVSIATVAGTVQASVYRPRSRGPHPGVLATFGIVPPGVVDPRIAQMGEAFARAGFAALLYCSPNAGDLRLEPSDVAELVDAYDFFLHEPYVDASRSGFSGVCIGSAYALMAAADPRIRDRVRFVFAYAPYSSMRSLAVDIASGTRDVGDVREPWDVDPLTWKVYVRSVTGWLTAPDAEILRRAFEDRIAWTRRRRSCCAHRPATSTAARSRPTVAPRGGCSVRTPATSRPRCERCRRPRKRCSRRCRRSRTSTTSPRSGSCCCTTVTIT
jgi:hypothetical protein